MLGFSISHKPFWDIPILGNPHFVYCLMVLWIFQPSACTELPGSCGLALAWDDGEKNPGYRSHRFVQLGCAILCVTGIIPLWENIMYDILCSPKLFHCMIIPSIHCLFHCEVASMYKQRLRSPESPPPLFLALLGLARVRAQPPEIAGWGPQ